MAALLSYLSAANVALALSVILSLIKILEKVFPNAQALKSAEADLASIGAKDVDGQ